MLKRNPHDDLVEILDEVQGSCEISVTILNEMLDYDKIQCGLMKLDLEEVPVLDFLKTTLSPFYVQVGYLNYITQNITRNEYFNFFLLLYLF